MKYQEMKSGTKKWNTSRIKKWNTWGPGEELRKINKQIFILRVISAGMILGVYAGVGLKIYEITL